jgi:carbonic anhydrase
MPHTIFEKRIQQHEEYFQLNRDLLTKLVAEGQKPEALYIACSDSRMMTEAMLGLKPGEYFVHRNIAACIPPSEQPELATTAVLEYAVRVLKVKHIIVCGHTDCGGVKTVDTPPSSEQLPAIAQWLSYIQPAQQSVDASQPDLPSAERHRAIVEQHVVNQLANLRSYDMVKDAENKGDLELHGWVKYLDEHTLRQYDPQTGLFES